MKSIEMENKLKEIYSFIIDYSDTNQYPPSVREICAKFSIKSTASAYLYLEKLKAKGLLEKTPDKKRAITISKQATFKSIPLLGEINAGVPIFAVESLEGYFPLPPDFNDGENNFALRVKGESMINCGIFDNDIIIVEKRNFAENGQIVVALIDDSATVKRFFKTKTKIVLHPENDEMEDILVDEVNILGIVKGLYRKY